MLVSAVAFSAFVVFVWGRGAALATAASIAFVGVCLSTAMTVMYREAGNPLVPALEASAVAGVLILVAGGCGIVSGLAIRRLLQIPQRGSVFSLYGPRH
jgi:hypothetical protein